MIRLMQCTIRTTALLFIIMIISVATQQADIKKLPWQFVAASLGANWLMMLFFAVKIHRYKATLYPIMFLVNPLMNWLYMVYGIFTAGQRTWGGPRADASAATEKITPQEAIEQAEATGDDLNIMPETFRPSMQAQRRRRVGNTTLLPSPSVEGRFVPGARHRPQLSGSDSDFDMKDFGHSRGDSGDLSDSDVSIHTPRPVNRGTELTEALGSSENLNMADPSELSRRLSILASSSSDYQSMTQSPLGRQSPMNAANLPDSLAQVLHEEDDGQTGSSERRVRTDQTGRRGSTERRKLRKRPRSPASMV